MKSVKISIHTDERRKAQYASWWCGGLRLGKLRMRGSSFFVSCQLPRMMFNAANRYSFVQIEKPPIGGLKQ